jgi:4-hydroxy-tetrahydrodipicolinate synthase
MLDRFATQGFDVFAGAESFLLATLRNGGKGCISATANVNPAPIHRLFANWRSADADRMQEELAATRGVFQKATTVIAAMKAAVAHYANDPGWTTLRPPLTELPGEQQSALLDELAARGFDMPGLRA